MERLEANDHSKATCSLNLVSQMNRQPKTRGLISGMRREQELSFARRRADPGEGAIGSTAQPQGHPDTIR